MLIEASSLRLCIDLIQSLERAGFIATEIRLNFKGSKRYFEDKKSMSSSIRYSSLAELKSVFMDKYSQIANTGNNPFTFNSANRFNFRSGSAKKGEVIDNIPTPKIGSDNIRNIFKLGRYVVIRGIKLSSKSLGFKTSYNCINTHKDNFKITRNTEFNRKAYPKARKATIKSEETIRASINRYKHIHDKFFDLYLKNQDYNLEYIDFVGDGPDGDVYKLYELHFPIIKRKLDSGLSADILKPKFLLKDSTPIKVPATTVAVITKTKKTEAEVTTIIETNAATGCTTIS